MIVRCPRLGHEVEFAYCRKESGNDPCERIVSCWQYVFNVEDFLRLEMGPEAWEKFSKRTTRDKVSTLLELIEQARLRQKWPR